MSHTELSKLVVRGSHIEPEVVDTSLALEPDVAAAVGMSMREAVPPSAVPMTQEEVELRRLSALTPVPLDQQRIHVRKQPSTALWCSLPRSRGSSHTWPRSRWRHNVPERRWHGGPFAVRWCPPWLLCRRRCRHRMLPARPACPRRMAA